jgi:hypothetical protein
MQRPQISGKITYNIPSLAKIITFLVRRVNNKIIWLYWFFWENVLIEKSSKILNNSFVLDTAGLIKNKDLM